MWKGKDECLCVGGGAGGAAGGRQNQGGGRRQKGLGVKRGDVCGRLRITALLCTGGASADELAAGKRLLKGINQIYPHAAWKLLRGRF